MWNKEPTMTTAMAEMGISIPQLTAGEMADIVSYLSSVQYFGEAGDPEAGERRILAKGCLDCHSWFGRGGPGGDLGRSDALESPAAVIAAMWNHILVSQTDPNGRPVTWPIFSPAEMADLAAYLQTEGRNR
jgi:mono/diheme cytochrome c family protein